MSDSTDRLPKLAEFHRLILGKCYSYARKWGCDADDLQVFFVQSVDTRSGRTNYELRGPKGQSQFFRDGKEAPMPVLNTPRTGTSHGRTFTSTRVNAVVIGPHSFDDVREMMEGCADYTPPRVAAE